MTRRTWRRGCRVRFYHASFNALHEAFAEFVGKDEKRRIVVFIDDLDRCLPDGALEVLEAIKLFFDMPGFVFVVGLDQRVVELSVGRRYRDVLADKGNTPGAEMVSGANYVRKIFQVPYSLAPVSPAQIDDFLQSISATANLPTPQWNEISQMVRPHLRFLADASGVNPREVKRYINAYTLVRKIRPHLNENIVLALQTIAFRADWRQIQLALLTFREAFINALTQHIQTQDVSSLEALSPGLGSLPQSFLTYIDATQPGNALVAGPFQLTEYLYSGEATRNPVDPKVLDLFRDIGQLFALVKPAFRERKYSELESQLDSIHSRLTDPTGPSLKATRVGAELGYARALLQSVEMKDAGRIVEENITAELRNAREQLRKFEEDVTTHIRQAISQLQELYQAGQ